MKYENKVAAAYTFGIVSACVAIACIISVITSAVDARVADDGNITVPGPLVVTDAMGREVELWESSPQDDMITAAPEDGIDAYDVSDICVSLDFIKAITFEDGMLVIEVKVED